MNQDKSKSFDPILEHDKQASLDGSWGAKLRLRCTRPFLEILKEFVQRNRDQEGTDRFNLAVESHVITELILTANFQGIKTAKEFEEVVEIMTRRIKMNAIRTWKNVEGKGR